MKIELDDWQKEALEHDGDLLLCTGRQVGKTTLMAIKASEFMKNHPGSKIIVCSLTEDQAQLMIVMVLDYLEKNSKTWIAKGSHKPTKNKIELTNKSSIIARPVGNTGDAVRGFTGDVLILDEASRFAEFIFTASKPTLLTTGGKIWMCSTPFGKQGYFYECYKNASGRFKVIEANSWDVVQNRPLSEVWTANKRQEAINFLENERKDMSELQFAQEYLGKFVDDLRQYFSDELIQKCCTLKRPEVFSPQRDFYMGCDIARMGDDEGTFEILDRLEKNKLLQVENIVTKKKLTTETEDKILELDRFYNFKKIYIDAGAGTLGVSIFDHLLANSQTSRKIVAINNRARALDRKDNPTKAKLLKEDLYDNLRSLMERGQIKLLDDDELILSLKSVQYEYETRTGKAPKVRIFGNYTHIAEGLIRAAWCSKEKSLNFNISYF